MLVEKFRGKGIFTRVLETMGAYVNSCETSVRRGWEVNGEPLRLEINTQYAKVQAKLAKMIHYECLGYAARGSFEYHPDSKRYKYIGAPDPPCVKEERLCLWNGDSSKQEIGLKPGGASGRTPDDFEPLVSIISTCPCGERTVFMDNGTPECACPVCDLGQCYA